MHTIVYPCLYNCHRMIPIQHYPRLYPLLAFSEDKYQITVPLFSCFTLLPCLLIFPNPSQDNQRYDPLLHAPNTLLKQHKPNHVHISVHLVVSLSLSKATIRKPDACPSHHLSIYFPSTSQANTLNTVLEYVLSHQKTTQNVPQIFRAPLVILATFPPVSLLNNFLTTDGARLYLLWGITDMLSMGW